MQSVFLTQEQIQALFQRDSLILAADEKNKISEYISHQSKTQGIPTQPNQFRKSKKVINSYSTTEEDFNSRQTDKQLTMIPAEEYERLKILEKENQLLKSKLDNQTENIKSAKQLEFEVKSLHQQMSQEIEKINFLSEQNFRLKNQVNELQDKQKKLIDESTHYHGLYIQTQMKLRELQQKSQPSLNEINISQVNQTVQSTRLIKNDAPILNPRKSIDNQCSGQIRHVKGNGRDKFGSTLQSSWMKRNSAENVVSEASSSSKNSQCVNIQQTSKIPLKLLQKGQTTPNQTSYNISEFIRQKDDGFQNTLNNKDQKKQ